MNRVVLYVVVLISLLYAERYAVLVGNSYGGSDLVSLKYVSSDLKEMKAVLEENCLFDRTRISVLKNDSPAQLLSHLDSLKSVISPDDLLYFYYTGHADARSLRMGNYRLDLKALKTTLDSLDTKFQMVVLDACQSGSFSRLKGGTIEEPLLLKQTENSNSGRVVLYSSADTEFSQESDYLGHSIFSFYFMNGLKGMADLSGDKRVTVDEAYKYAYRQTVAATVHSAGGIQHPGYLFDYRGKGDIVLADMTGTATGIILDRGISGQVAILDPTKQVVADFTTESDRDIFVALNPGRYTVYRNSDGEAFRRKVIIGAEPVFVTSLNFQQVKSIPLRGKGIGSRKPRLSLQVLGGALWMDHNSIYNYVNEREILRYISTTYDAGFRAASFRISGGLGIELPGGVLFQCNAGYAAFSTEGADSGTIAGPEGELYPTSIDHVNSLSIFDIETIAGYRFKKGPKNLLLLTGLALSFSYFYGEIHGSEQLWNSSFDLYEEIDDMDVMFLGGIGYSFPITSFLDISARGLYSLEISNDDPSYSNESIDPSGWKLSAGFTFFLTGE